MKKIAEFLEDTSHLKHCTKEFPMPESADATKEAWIHHDVTELEDLDTFGIKYRCNSCGIKFIDRC